MNKPKRYIPGSNPAWGRELPDEDSNSLVDKNGKNWDNGYNFDERDTEPEETTYDDLANEVKFRQEGTEETREESLTDDRVEEPQTQDTESEVEPKGDHDQ